MSEQSMTPDLVELVRRQFEAANRRDLDAAVSSPPDSAGNVRQREGWVHVWVGGLIERFASYGDIAEARAAAERLAQERG